MAGTVHVVMPPSCLVLVNRASGTVRSDDGCFDRMLRHGALDGAELRVISDPTSIAEITAEALDRPIDLVVAGGGDGTIHTVVNAVMGSRDGSPTPALAVLPLGTANDFARTLGVEDLDTALDAVASVRAGHAGPSGDRGAIEDGGFGVVASDLLRIEFDDGPGQYAVNILLAGFGGRVQEQITPELKARWGPLAYLRGGLSALDESRYHATVRFEDAEAATFEFFNLAAANGRFSGGGYDAAPAARLDDGTMEVLVAAPVDLAGLASLAAFLRKGEHVQHDAVQRYRTTRMRIETEEPLDYSIDGEPRQARGVLVEVLAGALPMVMGPRPAPTPA